MIDINLSGVWHTVKAGVPHILAGGRGGSIVLTGSVGRTRPIRTPATTSPPSTACIGLMRAFAVELGQHNDSGQLGAAQPGQHAR